MKTSRPVTVAPGDPDDPRGRDQQPETDVWRPYAVAGLHRGPDHTHHAGHRDREATR